MVKKIGVIASSSPAKEERINKGIKALEERGFEVVKGKSVNQSYFTYLSGSDERRSEDINEMFARKDIDMIICQNGGYGSPRIVDKIDYSLIADNKKVFCGFSDVSLLLNTIYMNTGLLTYHGPMVSVDFLRDQEDPFLQSFFTLLNHEDYVINEHGEHDIRVIKEGVSEGILVGGNLSLLTVFAAMDYKDYFKGKILFIEEVKEKNYRIDRMLQILRLKGVFDDLKGLIIGGITGDETPQKGSFELCKDLFKDYQYPIMFNAPIGHVRPRYTVIIGGLVKMDTANMNITVRGNNQ